jgi:hypothetical protein
LSTTPHAQILVPGGSTNYSEEIVKVRLSIFEANILSTSIALNEKLSMQKNSLILFLTI